MTHKIPHPQNRNQKFIMDNHWVVPYNPYLTCHFGAYINIEVYSSVQAIKYIHQNIYKGSDHLSRFEEIQSDLISSKKVHRTNRSYVENIWVFNTLWRISIYWTISNTFPRKTTGLFWRGRNSRRDLKGNEWYKINFHYFFWL